MFGAKQCLRSATESEFKDLVTSLFVDTGSAIDSFLSLLDNCLKVGNCISRYVGVKNNIEVVI